MELLGVLNFAVECFDVLAWPLFAVCYPLCVSIQAVEANSISDTKKLITYWVSFSLILLFEYAFEKILEWLPSWDYIKLMVVFCLVMPHFNGSLYVYRHLVHPCLSVDPDSVNLLIKQKNFLLNLFAEMERDVKENGADALDNRIASEVRCIEHDLPMVDNRASAPHDPHEIAVEKLPEIPVSEQVQKQWTCAICQVTVHTETIFKSHLRGRRHKAACELLNAKKQKPKSADIPSSYRNKATVPSSTAAASVKELLENDLTCTLCNLKLKSEIDAQSHVYGKRHKAALEKQKANVQAPLRCIISNVSCTSRGDMDCHLAAKKHLVWMKKSNSGEGCYPLGKTHRAALEEQKAEVQASLHCIVCNVSCTSQGDMDCHLGGKKHLARMEELNSDGGLDSA